MADILPPSRRIVLPALLLVTRVHFEQMIDPARTHNSFLLSFTAIIGLDWIGLEPSKVGASDCVSTWS